MKKQALGQYQYLHNLQRSYKIYKSNKCKCGPLQKRTRTENHLNRKNHKYRRSRRKYQ